MVIVVVALMVLPDMPTLLPMIIREPLELILNTQGFENHIADILEKELKTNNECLYIETHRFCVKIILEYKDLAIVAEKMYKLIGYIPFKPSDNS